MKLIFIYGPPAAGKLSVGRALCARTGFKLFHNHLALQCVQPVFAFGTESCGRLVASIRMEMIAEAARTGTDLVFTFCYKKRHDDIQVLALTRLVEDQGGEVCFVQLWCDKKQLEQRITHPERAPAGKICTVEALREVMRQVDLLSPVSFRPSFRVDTTKLSPDQSSEMIAEHYKL